jgi:hypothetical protein
MHAKINKVDQQIVGSIYLQHELNNIPCVYGLQYRYL